MAKRKNITRVPTWQAQWKRGWKWGRKWKKRSGENVSRGEERRGEKEERQSYLSLLLSFDESSSTTRGKKVQGGKKGGNREEEGFVAERGFQRSQLLDASRTAGAGRGVVVVACIDVKGERVSRVSFFTPRRCWRRRYRRVRALYEPERISSCRVFGVWFIARLRTNWFPSLFGS